jgi:hypothetical protein
VDRKPLDPKASFHTEMLATYSSLQACKWK